MGRFGGKTVDLALYFLVRAMDLLYCLYFVAKFCPVSIR